MSDFDTFDTYDDEANSQRSPVMNNNYPPRPPRIPPAPHTSGTGSH